MCLDTERMCRKILLFQDILKKRKGRPILQWRFETVAQFWVQLLAPSRDLISPLYI